MRDMCEPLKAVSAKAVKPKLQVMYFNAAAVAQGECSLPVCWFPCTLCFPSPHP